MFDKLGAKGIVGLLALVAGIAVIAVQSLIIAAGIGLVVVGFVLTAWGLVSGLLANFGMGGMMGVRIRIIGGKITFEPKRQSENETEREVGYSASRSFSRPGSMSSSKYDASAPLASAGWSSPLSKSSSSDS